MFSMLLKERDSVQLAGEAGIRRWFPIIVAGLLVFGIALASNYCPRPSAGKTLRAGADDSPPYHVIQQDGTVRGLAVDILNEAARRRHIRLIWIPIRTAEMEDALVRGVVDFWPALSRTPARDKVLHFSKPWLESNYCILSRKDREITREDTPGISLGVAISPRVTALSVKYFPQAQRKAIASNLEVVTAVCRGDVVAGFLDARTLDSVLLDRPTGCEAASLRVHFVHEASNPVSMGGRKGKAGLIDDLREGVTPLLADGTFARALDRWSGFSGAQARAYFELREAQSRADIYFAGLVMVLLAGALLAWQSRAQLVANRRTREALSNVADSEARFDAFMNHSPMVGFVKDEAGRLLFVNQRFREVFEPLVGECVGKTDSELWPPEAAEKIRNDDLKIVREWRSAETLDLVAGQGGETRTWLSMKFPFRMNGRSFLGGLAADITDRERANQAIRISKEQFRTAFEHAVIGMSMNDLSGRFLKVNTAFCELTGYSSEELLLMDYTCVTHPGDLASGAEMRQAALDAGRSDFRVETRYVRKDEATVWVRLSVGIVRDHQGQPGHYIALVEDITAARYAKELELISEQRWQLALKGATDGIWDWNARDNTIFFSARYKEMLGYEEGELPNRPEVWEFLLHPQDLAYAREAVDAHLQRRTPNYKAEYRLRCKNGAYKWVLARGTAVWDASGNPVRLIGTHTDITDRKDTEERLTFEACHDPLTGLPNRRHFFSRLESEMNQAIENTKALSICLCDLDHFKDINDGEGHRAGDDVLKAFARVLRECLRVGDLGGRIGGDEFCVLLPGTDAVRASACMERFRSNFEAVVFIGNRGTPFHVTASFGVAEFAVGASASELLENADHALYRAKAQGRNAVQSSLAGDLQTLASQVIRSAPDANLGIQPPAQTIILS